MRIDEDAINRFGKALATQGKQPATIESYCRDARQFMQFITDTERLPEHLTPEVLQQFQEHQSISGKSSENSVRRSVIGVRQFFRFLAGEGNNTMRSPFDDAPIPERTDRSPKHSDLLSLERIQEAALAGGPRVKGYRDAAIVALLAYEGVKAGELIELTWRDILFQEQLTTLRIRSQRSRTVCIHPKTEYLLRRYRQAYQEFMGSLKNTVTDARMFISFKGKDGSKPIPKMTRHGLKFVLYEIGKKVGIPKLNTELLRHHAVDFLLTNGRGPDEVMAHLGLRRMGNIKKHLTLQQTTLRQNAVEHDR